MRALVFDRFGPPDEVLRLADVSAPEPGPGEVRIRLSHRPINPADVLTVVGVYPVRPSLPGSPGLEGVGRVDAVGDGVRGPAIGARVIPLAGLPGTWAEQMVLRADQVLQIPDGVSDQSAAQLLVNPFTVYALLTDELQLARGDWLLQTAAGSTLGRMVIQLARRRGIRTINVVRRRAQAEELLSLGADAVVATDDEPLVERVMAITEGQGARGAIDAVGGALGADVARSLGRGGVMIAFGLLSGETTMPVDVADLLFKGSAVRGFWLPLWFAAKPPDAMAHATAEVVTLVAEGVLTPQVAAEYDLADFREALAHANRAGRSGKVLLVG